jgi:hypothetical protein
MKIKTLTVPGLYMVFIALAPFVFYGFNLGVYGALFTTLALALHYKTSTAAKPNREVAIQAKNDLNQSSSKFLTSILTYAFLVSNIKKQGVTREASTNFLVSCLLCMIFFVPDLSVHDDSMEAYYVRTVQTVVLCYALGIFISGFSKTL